MREIKTAILKEQKTTARGTGGGGRRLVSYLEDGTAHDEKETKMRDQLLFEPWGPSFHNVVP